MDRKEIFIASVEEWCADNAHGYSQANRWGPDCDCSSLVYMAALSAGYDVPRSGTRCAGTIVRDFGAAGFTVLPFDGVLGDCGCGYVLLNEGQHVEVVVAPGLFGGARIDEHGGVQGCCEGDQTGNEVSVVPWYVPSYG